MFSTRSTVDNIIVSLDGDRTGRYVKVEALCCTPETNVTRYFNYTLIKKCAYKLSIYKDDIIL